MFKSKKVRANLDCVPLLKVKGLMGCFRGYLRVAIVPEDTVPELVSASLYEINHWLDWHLILYAADDNVIGKLAEPLVLDLLECR